MSKYFFNKYPKDFYSFYRENLIYPDAKPNDCHKVLAELERIGKLSFVLTQNIDGLHQLAGSKNVLELHGSVHKNYCVRCQRKYDVEYILNTVGIPLCKCGGFIKPGIVLFEESLDKNLVNKAINIIKQADTLIIGGTSLVVYPAAGLLRYFRGRHSVLINREPTDVDEKMDIVIHKNIGKVMENVIREYYRKRGCN